MPGQAFSRVSPCGYDDYEKKVSNAPAGEQRRVLRGASFGSDSSYARGAYRAVDGPFVRDTFIGFRVVAPPG